MRSSCIPGLLRLSPGAQRVCCPGHEGVVCSSSIPQSHELHVQGCRFGVAYLPVVHQQLFKHLGEELNTRLPLSCADQGGAADLVQNSRSALLGRWIDDVAFERLNQLQLVLSTVEA